MLLSTLGAASCASQPPPRSAESPLLNEVMPTFESESLNGSPLEPGTFYGHPVVLIFATPDCPACIRALSAGQELYTEQRGVVVLGVLSRIERKQALSVTGEHQLRFPVVSDESGSLAELFQVQDAPRTFVIDKQGWVRWVGGADMTGEALEQAVSSVR